MLRNLGFEAYPSLSDFSEVIEGTEGGGFALCIKDPKYGAYFSFAKGQQNSTRFVDAPVSPYNLTLLYSNFYKVQFTKDPRYLNTLYIL